MRFLSTVSRISVPQAIAWTVIIVILVTIYIEGGLQAYGVYQESLDFADFCIRFIRQRVMNLM
ncbi:MAG: hypothetical protein CL874_00660 [Dehalococcoidales bacterium]|jgi:hypothetical protein|nr:hypothetical protein [Dehalococcoidales bacterium]